MRVSFFLTRKTNSSKVIRELRSEKKLTHFELEVEIMVDKEQLMAETFFYLRVYPDPRVASIGKTSCHVYYPVDKGFEGYENRERWKEDYGAYVICPPKSNSRSPWPKELRRWVASIRQIVETVFDKLLYTFRLDRERPHLLGGIRTRLAAKVALHNFCIWFNRQSRRLNLAFADLLGWS